MGVGGQHHAQTATENIAPTGIRSPDRPARSESLYRLSYPGPFCLKQLFFKMMKHVLVKYYANIPYGAVYFYILTKLGSGIIVG